MRLHFRLTSALAAACFVLICATSVPMQAHTSKPTTKITVRIQAKGGKYLGDDIGGAWISIRNQQTGEILASGVTHGDAGTVSDKYVSGASGRAIITPTDSPQVHWVLAGSATSHFTAELSLDHTAMLEISAWGATGGLQAAHRVVATQWQFREKIVWLMLKYRGCSSRLWSRRRIFSFRRRAQWCL